MRPVRFSVPFNGSLPLAEKAVRAGKVSEIYFSPWPRDLRAANYYGGSERERTDRGTLRRLYSLCRENGVRLNLLCNSPLFDFGRLEKIKAAIRRLGEPDSITLADPLAIAPFRKAFPGAGIQASVIMNLDNRAKLARALELGVGTVTLPPSLNRDGRALEDLRRLKKKFPLFRVKLIANNDCFPDCVFTHSHYSHGAVTGEKGAEGDPEDGPTRLCHMYYRSPADFIKIPFIRPEDTAFYAERGWCDEFKLIYRAYPDAVLERIFSTYFSGRLDGDLFEVVPSKNAAYEAARGTARKAPRLRCHNPAFPPGFVRRVTSCSRDCAACSYCDTIARRTGCRVK
jgi:collagenase-like PrtC family protease